MTIEGNLDNSDISPYIIDDFEQSSGEEEKKNI
jgi:hypothetical protein